ncbi:MAG: hypothetical protein ABIP29_11230 [Candidatus Eisenbacteria bacterium]
MKPVSSFLIVLLGLAALFGCGPQTKSSAPAVKGDIVERMFAGRAAGHGFRPAGVAQAIADAEADSVARVDSLTALAVWIELRKDEEGALMGAWAGDTTLVQIAGGTGLRGFARPGEAGADLLALARVEASLFTRAGDDLEPPADGQARLWVITPAGVRRRDEPIGTFLDPDRRSTPFLQEARLFVRTTLGNVVEFETGTAATLESLGVTPQHTAAKLARAVGIDPDAEH